MDVRESKRVITVAPLGANESIWQNFLARSTNGTLFHDLRFLRYHPENRFRFHHLMMMHIGKPVALIPGGLAESGDRPMFCSPLGASIGGLVVAAGLRADFALAMVEALQKYVRDQNWGGIEVTLPPRCYSFATADLIEFALFCRGFRLEHRWLCPVLELLPEPNGFERTYRPRQASFVRAARRKGMNGIETGIDGLDNFLVPFRDTYARHGVSPTHTEDEIRDLLTRLPGSVRIHLAQLGDVPVAALLVFKLSATVAYTFYICSNSKHVKEHGQAFLIADLIDRLSKAGIRYIDLGPSASDLRFNEGVTFFKEGLGGIGQCRDRWRWEVGNPR